MNVPWHAQWIGAADDCTSFCAETQIFVSDLKRARLYVGCAGLYTLYINDQRVGTEYLTPYCNAYDAWMQAITHDVTEYLRESQNTLRFTLGSGWYKGRFSLMNRENIYGDRLAVIAELVLTHSDGSEERIVTDERWRVFSSEYTQNGIYDGVHIDAGAKSAPHFLHSKGASARPAQSPSHSPAGDQARSRVSYACGRVLSGLWAEPRRAYSC